MRSYVTPADAAGKIEVPDACHSFALLPAAQAVSYGGYPFRSYLAGIPGEYPVRVTPKEGGEELVIGSWAVQSAGSCRAGFTVAGCYPGSYWRVVLLDADEKWEPAEASVYVTNSLPPTLIPTELDAEPLEIPLPRSCEGISLFPSGTPQPVNIYARRGSAVVEMLAQNWSASSTLTFVPTDILRPVSLLLVASAAGVSVEVDLQFRAP